MAVLDPRSCIRLARDSSTIIPRLEEYYRYAIGVLYKQGPRLRKPLQPTVFFFPSWKVAAAAAAAASCRKSGGAREMVWLVWHQRRRVGAGRRHRCECSQITSASHRPTLERTRTEEEKVKGGRMYGGRRRNAPPRALLTPPLPLCSPPYPPFSRGTTVFYTVFSRNPACVLVHRSLFCFPSFPASLLTHTTALPVDA